MRSTPPDSVAELTAHELQAPWSCTSTTPVSTSARTSTRSPPSACTAGRMRSMIPWSLARRSARLGVAELGAGVGHPPILPCAWRDVTTPAASGTIRAVTVKVLGVFSAASETREFPAGTVIFEAGSTGQEMFGVVKGKVELRLADGRSFEVGQDETFGEMALVDASARSATATALEDTTLAVIDKRRFLFLVGETPTFALQVMASLAERLRAMQGAG